MSIPHFKDSDRNINIGGFTSKLTIYGKNYMRFMKTGTGDLGEGYYTITKHSDEINNIFLKYTETIIDDEDMQKIYLIYLILCKIPNPHKKIINFIESNDLKNIELAYLLTYPNEES